MIMFIYFSSAFYTFQPLLLNEKLLMMGVSASTAFWTADHLLDRSQFVHLGNAMSDVVVSNPAVPKGTVLPSFLFTLYALVFQYNSCHLQKFFVDYVVVGCIRCDGQETEYRELAVWCSRNHLM